MTQREELRNFILEHFEELGEATVSSNIAIGYPNIPNPPAPKEGDEDEDDEDVAPHRVRQVDFDNLEDTNSSNRGNMLKNIRVR